MTGFELDLDRYIPKWNIFKKGRLRIVIHFQDKTYKVNIIKFKEDYTVTIKKKKYFVLQDCITYGKYPTLEYYYNNPFPINFKFEESKLTAEKINPTDFISKQSKEIQSLLAETTVDAQSVQILYNSKLIAGLYETGGLFSNLKWWHWLIILGGVGVLYLQLTGTFDVFGWLGITQGGATSG